VSVDARLMVVISAIRQSIEMNGGPASSVNRHPNQFFLNVIGEVDLLKAAELVLKRLDAHTEAKAAQPPTV
jgi:hypothetical protein